MPDVIPPKIRLRHRTHLQTAETDPRLDPPAPARPGGRRPLDLARDRRPHPAAASRQTGQFGLCRGPAGGAVDLRPSSIPVVHYPMLQSKPHIATRQRHKIKPSPFNRRTTHSRMNLRNNNHSDTPRTNRDRKPLRRRSAPTKKRLNSEHPAPLISPNQAPRQTRRTSRRSSHESQAPTRRRNSRNRQKRRTRQDPSARTGIQPADPPTCRRCHTPRTPTSRTADQTPRTQDRHRHRRSRPPATQDPFPGASFLLHQAPSVLPHNVAKSPEPQCCFDVTQPAPVPLRSLAFTKVHANS
jgi:hypothetical protein